MKKLHISRPTPAMVVAILALIVALGGSAYAAKKIGSKQLKKNAVTTKKIKNGAVTGAKIANNAVDSGKIAANAVTTGKIAANAVTTGKIADNAVTSGKIASSAADSLTVGRSVSSSCDPASATFVDCGTVALNLPRSGRVLIEANANFDGANSGAGYRGDCRITVDGTQIGGQNSNGSSTGTGVGFNGNNEASTGLNAITEALAVGTHNLALQCNQAGGSIEFGHTYVSAMAIGAG